MTTSIYEVFKDEIWQPEDHTDHIWTASCESLSYNTENKVDDLFNEDGETYSGDIQGEIEKD